MGLDYALRRRGPLTMAPSQLGAFTRSDPTRERANIQFHVQPLSLDKFGDPLHAFPGLHRERLQSAPDQPRLVRLRSADPADKPVISPNYLSTRKTGASPPIRSASRAGSWRSRRCRNIKPVEYLPGDPRRETTTRPALVKAAGDIGTTIFHPVGTAKMGRDDDPHGGGGRAAAGDRAGEPAGDRRLGDADDHLRQHQFADHDDRGEGRGDDPARMRQTSMISSRTNGGVS